MSLKEVAFTEVGCVGNKEIEHFQSMPLILGISIGKLQKTKVRKIQSYVSWRKNPASNYMFKVNNRNTRTKV